MFLPKAVILPLAPVTCVFSHSIHPIRQIGPPEPTVACYATSCPHSCDWACRQGPEMRNPLFGVSASRGGCVVWSFQPRAKAVVLCSQFSLPGPFCYFQPVAPWGATCSVFLFPHLQRGVNNHCLDRELPSDLTTVMSAGRRLPLKASANLSTGWARNASIWAHWRPPPGR